MLAGDPTLTTWQIYLETRMIHRNVWVWKSCFNTIYRSSQRGERMRDFWELTDELLNSVRKTNLLICDSLRWPFISAAKSACAHLKILWLCSYYWESQWPERSRNRRFFLLVGLEHKTIFNEWKYAAFVCQSEAPFENKTELIQNLCSKRNREYKWMNRNE